MNSESVLKIELKECQMKMNNEIAIREIIAAKNQNMEEKIKELQEELLVNISK